MVAFFLFLLDLLPPASRVGGTEDECPGVKDAKLGGLISCCEVVIVLLDAPLSAYEGGCAAEALIGISDGSVVVEVVLERFTVSALATSSPADLLSAG